jgi:PAS domain S-box-containing protein/putative nucleotidyltransferase with HDIG domain
MRSKITESLREFPFSESKTRINVFFWALGVIWTLLNAAQIAIEWLFEARLSPHFYTAALLVFFVWSIGIIGISLGAEEIANQLKAQKEYQKKFREGEEKYRLLVDMSPDAIALHSNGKILYVNEAAVRMMRAPSAADLIGMPVIEFVHPSSRNVVMQRIMTIISSGVSLPAEEELFVARDGTPIPVETIAAPLNFNGEPAIMTISRDIRERKTAQEAESKANRQLRETLETIQLIAVTIDAQSMVSFCNDYFLELTGWTREEVIGKNWFDIFLPPEVNLREFFQENIANGNLPIYFENPILTKNGKCLWIAWNNTLLRNMDGSIAGATSIGQDITERKRIEAAIDRIEQGASAKIGAEFFDSLTRHLAETLECDYTFVAKQDKPSSNMTTLSFYSHGAALPNYTYSLENTPCARVTQKGICCFPQNVAAEFPKDDWLVEHSIEGYIGSPLKQANGESAGILVALFQKPIRDLHYAQAIMSIFAARASAEIERSRLYDDLQREGLKYRNLFEHANDAILIIDPDTRGIIDSNQVAADQIGYSSGELRALTLDQIIDAGELDQTPRQMRQLERDGSLIYETGLRRKNGERIEIEISAHVAEYDKRPVFQFFLRDITERKHNEQEVRKQIERISALREIDAVISSSLDLHLNLSVILEQAVHHLGMDAAMILAYHTNTLTFTPLTHKGFRGSPRYAAPLSLAKSYAGRAAIERQTIHIADLQTAQGFSESAEFKAEEFVSYYAVPLIVKGEIKGVMELFHRAPRQADSESIGFMETLAGQVAIALDNAALFDTLQRANSNLTIAYDQTLEGWAESLETQDYETQGHSKRTADLAMRLAMEVGLSPEQTADIRRGALLHDIGKLNIPESIRNKRDPLTNDEWEVVKQHPKIAFNILSKIEFLKNSLAIPNCHHENWDGSGYPHGLRESAIPIAARVFSIVDVWDSLTSPQSYREAWSKTQTIEYINAQKGIRFDPVIVDAFVHLVSATGEIKNTD